MLTNNKHVIVSFTGYVLMTLIFFFILINVYRLFFLTPTTMYISFNEVLIEPYSLFSPNDSSICSIQIKAEASNVEN